MSSAPQTSALPVMGSLIVLVNKRADWNVPVSYIKYMSSCSACGFSIKKTSKVNTILKVVIFKNYVILFRCSMICRWPEPWNFKTSHFRILYSFPSSISAPFLLHTKTYDWQQKLPDNREYIQIQEWLLKQSYVQRNI